MTKGALTLFMLLLFVFQASFFATSWKGGDISLPELQEETIQKQVEAPPETVFSPYPDVPPTLPDLNKGYLFNEAREISVAAPGEEAETEGDGIELTDVIYSGSIIVGDVKRGLLVFSQTTQGPIRSSSRRPAAAVSAMISGGQKKNQQVTVGDEVGGYKVQEIHPDRIIFAKNGQTVEKGLYDTEKKRIIPPQVNRTVNIPLQIPPQQGQLPTPPQGQLPVPPQEQPAVLGAGGTDSRNDDRIPPTKSSSLRTESSPALRRPRPQSANSPIPAGLRIPEGNIPPPPPEGAQ